MLKIVDVLTTFFENVLKIYYFFFELIENNEMMLILNIICWNEGILKILNLILFFIKSTKYMLLF